MLHRLQERALRESPSPILWEDKYVVDEAVSHWKTYDLPEVMHVGAIDAELYVTNNFDTVQKTDKDVVLLFGCDFCLAATSISSGTYIHGNSALPPRAPC